jgi:hypothetical protein
MKTQKSSEPLTGADVKIYSGQYNDYLYDILLHHLEKDVR